MPASAGEAGVLDRAPSVMTGAAGGGVVGGFVVGGLVVGGFVVGLPGVVVVGLPAGVVVAGFPAGLVVVPPVAGFDVGDPGAVVPVLGSVVPGCVEPPGAPEPLVVPPPEPPGPVLPAVLATGVLLFPCSASVVPAAAIATMMPTAAPAVTTL